MSASYLIGLDYGTASARGVLIDVDSGNLCDAHSVSYRHGTMTSALPDGTNLPGGWALQNAADYTECAQVILSKLARGKHVEGIGIGFTASSPLPTLFDGTPLSYQYPNEPHAYVKLWKHHSAQPWAESINEQGGEFLKKFGGKTSAEWLPAKAAQMASEAPALWEKTARFIEAGDWLVWQLTGQESRSTDMARFKAHHSATQGYPTFDVVADLSERVVAPTVIGSSGGTVCSRWLDATGILGSPAVAVAVIDSHVVLPALGAVEAGTLVGALGTSAVWMLLDNEERALPPGIEGVAKDAALPDLWCYEAGQAGFGDVLAWFAKLSPIAKEVSDNFSAYNAAAEAIGPGQSGLLALDWWSGCRAPLADPDLSGMLLGLRVTTTPAEIYRALLESICFGARMIVAHMKAGNVPITRTILASGLSKNNRFLVQLMADVLGTVVEVPELEHSTAVGAAIHGAVAARTVRNFSEGAARFGAQAFASYTPNQAITRVYDQLFNEYAALSGLSRMRESMHLLRKLFHATSE